MRYLLVTSAALALMVILAPAAEAGKRGTNHNRYAKQRTQVNRVSSFVQAPQVVYVENSRVNSVAAQSQTIRTPASGQTYTLVPCGNGQYTLVPSRVAAVTTVVQNQR